MADGLCPTGILLPSQDEAQGDQFATPGLAMKAYCPPEARWVRIDGTPLGMGESPGKAAHHRPECDGSG